MEEGMSLKSFIESHGDSFPYPITMANQDLPDQPIVYVNKFFRDMTGYENEEIIGKNCRFLQAGKTDPATKEKLREAIEARLPICQDLKNYTKNGEVFYNRLVMIPFRTGGQRFFLGLQHIIPLERFKPTNEVPHNDLMDRTINPLSILLSLELVADSRFNDEFQNMIRKIQNFILGL